MLAVVEDFKQLVMRVLSRACVRFYPTENYYQGCGVKAKYRFEYNERFRTLLQSKLKPKVQVIDVDKCQNESEDSGEEEIRDELWNKMC